MALNTDRGGAYLLRLLLISIKCHCYIEYKCVQFFSQPQQCSYPSIFIYGHRASGKSHVMQVLLRELEVRKRCLLSAQGLIGAGWCLCVNIVIVITEVRGSMFVVNMRNNFLFCRKLLQDKQAENSVKPSFLHQSVERELRPWKYYISLKVQKVWGGSSIPSVNSIAFSAPKRCAYLQCVHRLISTLFI